jgi:hypothetical protein
LLERNREGNNLRYMLPENLCDRDGMLRRHVIQIETMESWDCLTIHLLTQK